jgi:hypothetical protein
MFWRAPRSPRIVSVGPFWAMLLCCHCSWQSQLEHFETCWCAASACDSVSEGTEIRDHHCMSVRNSALYQTRTSNSGRTIGASMYLWQGSTLNVTMLCFVRFHFVTKCAWIPRLFTSLHIFLHLQTGICSICECKNILNATAYTLKVYYIYVSSGNGYLIQGLVWDWPFTSVQNVFRMRLCSHKYMIISNGNFLVFWNFVKNFSSLKTLYLSIFKS